MRITDMTDAEKGQVAWAREQRRQFFALKAAEVKTHLLMCPNCGRGNTFKDPTVVEVRADDSGLLQFCNSCGNYSPMEGQ